MSSFFEGQYRRTPEQNLSGSNHTENRDQFLQRAHLERQKREDNRRRFICSITIQSYVRSYLVRKRIKQKHREEFQEILSGLKGNVTLDSLSLLTSKLLFFYDMKTDETSLLAISKLILDKQFKLCILEASLTPGNIWSVRTRKLLTLNFQLMSYRAREREFNSTVCLRLLETFMRAPENRDALVAQFTKSLRYLVENQFYRHIRILLDAKVPPLLEATPVPATPLSQCLFDLLVTPLSLISTCRTCDPMYSSIVMEEFIRHIVGAPMTEPIRLFVLPALAQMTSFPYQDLVLTVHSNFAKKDQSSSNANILYALLTLVSGHAYLTNQNRDASPSAKEKADVALVSAHLSVIAESATELIRMEGPNADEGEDEGEEKRGDIDMELGEVPLSPMEQQLLEECCVIFNQNSFVQAMISIVERYYHDISVLQPLCQLCHTLLMSHRLAYHRFRLLHMLALNVHFVRQLYSLATSLGQKSIFNTAGPPVTLLSLLARGSPLSPGEAGKIVPLLATWSCLFSLLVTTLHDQEFYWEQDAMDEQSTTGNAGRVSEETKMPFTLAELGSMTSVLKNVVLGLIELAYPDSRMKDIFSRQSIANSSGLKNIVSMWCHLFKSLVSLLRSLHSRDSRRRFTSGDAHWSCLSLTTLLGTGEYDNPNGISFRTRDRTSRPPFCRLPPLTREDLEEGPPLSTRELRMLAILRDVPFLVSFPARVLVLTRELSVDKAQHQARAPFQMGPQIQISVRRNYIYEDAFDKLSPENEPELRHVMRVQLVNAVGLDEAGIDGGGVFREFLSELLKTAFDPKLGFFRLTEDNLLYPNPGVALIHPNYLKHYYFIGRMLGKALYENLLVEIPLADLFLSKLVSRHSDVDIHHLATLDALLYRNLLSLKNVEDVMDLGLDFTVLCDELGERRIIELKPQGASIPVTNSNRIEYIHLVADYYLNKRIRVQCGVFKQGLIDIIAPDLLQLFNSRELGTLISGAETPIDLEDLKAHTSYQGGFTNDHETIRMFWEVVTSFSDSERKSLLKFVTSCSRPPLLGFKELDPPFSIQLINSEDRLPSASTCMNLLKLPMFKERDKLRERLVYAISSHCGFELS